MLKRYLVTWEIDIFDADSPREAAQQAFDAVRRPGTLATVFKVVEHDTGGEAISIDLLDDSLEEMAVDALEKVLADDIHR